MGGKTTSLQAVHQIFCRSNEVQLVSINTEEDSTLLFDFLPINLGQVEGFKIRIQGFTVPGQPKYKLMRKYVLSGADAVVLVVDSEASRLEENIASMESMRKNLELNGLDPETIPLVLQYNKRDLKDVLSEEALDQSFKFREGLTSFPTVATEGQGVFETFVHAAGLLVEAKVQLYGLDKGKAEPQKVAEGARRKLWEIYDRVRGTDRDRSGSRRTELTVTDDQVADPKRTKTGSAKKNRRNAKPGSRAKVKPTAGAKKTPGKTARDGDPDYELRDSAPVEVITDKDLDVELGKASAPQTDQVQGVSEEIDEHLLDKSVKSNLELVQRFGELDQYRALLERKNRDLVEIAQNTVHDLNRPLSAIKLMLSTMAKGYLGNLQDSTLQAVDNGLMAVTQMQRLIGDLMDSSRLDHDGLTLKFQEVDMTLLVASALRTLRFEIEENDVRARVEPLPTITADEWALTKVFMNLLGNAIHYAHPDRPAVIHIWAEEEEDRWVFYVMDNGIGMPEEDRERLFRRFERGTNTAGISGTGLGLHIVREVAMGHGGTVWVDSKEGDGSCFVVALPFEPVQPPHSTVTEVADKAGL
jgi:signal transduction histidine kinase/signal recognition particle receptor subunit beta